jgi:hypothetical protein
MEKSMAHFAKLDENNVVLEVHVVNNDDIQNLPFPQSEAVGIAFLNSFLPAATWKQTSYNNNFRFRYAGIDGTFHPECGEYGGFAEKYGTSEDFFLSKQYNPKKFKLAKHYFGQDSRRFKRMGYTGMAMYLVKNFVNRNNERYWNNLDYSKYWETTKTHHQ